MPNTPATWLDAVTVNTTTAGTRADARVTVLSNGNILITWTATTQAPSMPTAENIAASRGIATMPPRKRGASTR